MATEISTTENTISDTLDEVSQEQTYDLYGNAVQPASSGVSVSNQLAAVAVPLAQPTYQSSAKAKPVQDVSLNKKIICYDTETSDVDPWTDQLYVCSMWDLSKDVSTMVTFADWDERALTKQIADYLNKELPDSMVQYNSGFDQRHLLTRFMLYGEIVPNWNNIEQIDLMTILKNGFIRNLGSSQNAGTDEDWLMYFFGEKKPFTIDECMEGVRNHDLSRYVLRNRTCVQSEGDVFLLFCKATNSYIATTEEEKPTIVNITEEEQAGTCVEKCDVCGAYTPVKCGSTGNYCWRCSSPLPEQTADNTMVEQSRAVDYTQVGIKATTTKSTSTTTKKATTSTKKVTT